MIKPANRPATYADLEAVPPHLVSEIVFGSLVTHPRPAPLIERLRLGFRPADQIKLLDRLGVPAEPGQPQAEGEMIAWGEPAVRTRV